MTDYEKQFWFHEAVKYRTALKQIAALSEGCEYEKDEQARSHLCSCSCFRGESAIEIAKEVLK